MNLSYNVSYALAALVIGIVLIIVISLQYSSTNLVNKRFKYFLIASVVMYLLDIVTVATNDYAAQIPLWFNKILNTLYFLSGSTVAILFVYYVISVALKNETKKVRHNIYMINVIILGLHAISLIFNCFFGFYFFYTESFEYTHGNLYLLVNLITILYIIESIFILIYKRDQFNKAQAISTILFLTAFFISFGLQIFVFPKVLLSDFGSAIGALMIFFSIETPDYVKLMSTLNELNELKASLEIQVANRTVELDNEKKSYEELTLETLSSLASVIDAKDHYTNGHSFRVAAYSKGIAEILGLSFQECEQIYFAGLIHDVGKIGIDDAILTKPGKLNDVEYKVIQSHPALGGDILKGIKEFPIFEQVARSHHERYDGNGYPDKLKGEDIPFAARIVTISDTFDAMTSDRSYRKALSDEVAIAELKKYSGTQFDPQMVEAFLKLYDRYGDSIRNHIGELSSDVSEDIKM